MQPRVFGRFSASQPHFFYVEKRGLFPTINPSISKASPQNSFFTRYLAGLTVRCSLVGRYHCNQGDSIQNRIGDKPYAWVIIPAKNQDNAIWFGR